jgi:hypothetical protein
VYLVALLNGITRRAAGPSPAAGRKRPVSRFR